jgi:methylglyoxal/glyoxal reductase
MNQVPVLMMNNGVEIPALGFGTWQLDDGDEAYKATIAALNAGYRLVDTAKVYGNEDSVGDAIQDSGVSREEIFLTSKLWNSDQGYESAFKAFDKSLKRLGTDYLDLYLIHWPATDSRAESWKAFQKIYKDGKAKSIGVSNYTVAHLEELLGEFEITPAINQVEFHPFIYEEQKELLEYCNEKGIIVEAYSPLARAKNLQNPVLHAIANRHGKTLPQVMIRWALQHGTIPIPKSAHPDRIKENIKVFDFYLADEEMKTINKLSSGNRVTWDPTDLP